MLLAQLISISQTEGFGESGTEFKNIPHFNRLARNQFLLLQTQIFQYFRLTNFQVNRYPLLLININRVLTSVTNRLEFVAVFTEDPTGSRSDIGLIAQTNSLENFLVGLYRLLIKSFYLFR